MVRGERGRSGYQVVNGAEGVSVAAVAVVVSPEHASALVREHGESGWTGWLILWVPKTCVTWVDAVVA